jgi:preprotein translocase subunit SecE
MMTAAVRGAAGNWAASGVGSIVNVAFEPAKFAREVRLEVTKVTWPSRKETLVTTALVFAMAAVTSVFFFVVDQVIGLTVRAIFGAHL